MPTPQPLPFCFTSSLISSRSQFTRSPFIQSRQFSASPSHQKRTQRLKRFTRQRRTMFKWFEETGSHFKKPSSDGTFKYLGCLNSEGKPDPPVYSPVAKKYGAPSVAQEDGARAEPNADDESFDPNKQERREAEGKPVSLKGDSKDSEPKPKVKERHFRPFPLNANFTSQSVLSEELREIIYLQVTKRKESIRSVSVKHGVSMERVGAVVRMKQMERDWVLQNKPLAAVYSRTVLGMLPRTEYVPRTSSTFPRDIERIPFKPHESINDLAVHAATTQQIFHPVAESRAFTRADAGRAFHPNLLSADERIPHPQLIELEKFKATNPSTPDLRAFRKDLAEKEREAAERYLERKKKKLEQDVQVYQGQKYDFRFQDVSVESVGKDGRARAGVGWRYGMPHEDRKPGQVKIPTHV